MSRSADLKVNNFAEGTTNSDIAKSIVDFFSAAGTKILCIQQCANKIARVTFESKIACELTQLKGELDVGGVKVAVVPPPPPPPNWVNVVVYNYPYDAPNHYISDALRFFGKVQDVRYQHWSNLPEIATGTRVVRINLTRPIPRFMKINSYRCKVWYRGQPMFCDICKSGTHLAFSCPYKGKCLSCEGVGHLARNCPTVCFKCHGSHASGSCPNRRRWEHAPADDDDFRSVASDLGAGDDVTTDSVTPTETGAEVTGASVSGASDTGAANGPTPDCVVSDPPVDPVVSQPPTALEVDERLNQLDELQTQVDSSSQSMLIGLSGAGASGSVDSVSDVSPNEFSFAKPDVPMSEPSLSQKRGTSELLSSDESHRSRSRNRKSSRVAGPHVPSGVSAAVNLARSRSSSTSSRSPLVSKSSSKSKS